VGRQEKGGRKKTYFDIHPCGNLVLSFSGKKEREEKEKEGDKRKEKDAEAGMGADATSARSPFLVLFRRRGGPQRGRKGRGKEKSRGG